MVRRYTKEGPIHVNEYSRLTGLLKYECELFVNEANAKTRIHTNALPNRKFHKLLHLCCASLYILS